jgi:hypothetical protein
VQQPFATNHHFTRAPIDVIDFESHYLTCTQPKLGEEK